MPRSTADLAGRIASGDTEAFAELYRAWFDRLYEEARRCTRRDEAFCLDVVHDTMMRVVKSLTPMPNEAALARWLHLAVRSCAYDRLRREARRRRRERDAGGRPAPGPDRDPETAERLAWLRRQLGGLDAETAALLVMRHRLGWTLGRIGDTVGLTASAVDGRIRRVMSTLGRRAREVFHD